ncbi:retinol dehydrogenase 13 [Durotheca rogersii]|uniref:retinol dehydrogenase 13 n=1 Tax=Durotheca rogersii TaxID=419775 RepID=UPI00221FB0BE|nr:retinol dehydrogenase 13 [Durotheca rogersii]KAI5865791.1 retinol dehydrogenase 13 [Durotheca rogersii]
MNNYIILIAMSPFGFHSRCEDVAKAFADKIKGRTFLITGVSEKSIGANLAYALAAEAPARILLVGRNKSRIDPVVRRIATNYPDVVATFVPCDLTDFDSVRAAARRINEDAAIPRVDVVVNNAGVMAPVKYTLDKQGYELSLSANHLGHFLLTALLLPKIVAAAPGARVVNVSSRGHAAGPFRFDDWNFSGGAAYDGWSAYGQSKTANILFSAELGRRLAGAGIRAYAVHPGAIIGTGLADHLGEGEWQGIYEVALRNTGHEFPALNDLKDLSAGTASLAAAALDPDLDGQSGAYIVDCQVARPLEPYAEDPENARKLWELSEELVGQKLEL